MAFAKNSAEISHPDQVVALSAVLQLDLLNVAMIMLLQPDLTAAQIQESWRSGPLDAWEAQELQSLPIRDLDRLSRGDADPFMPLHTTSRPQFAPPALDAPIDH